MLVIMFALKMWRNYLYTNICEIYINYKSLKYIFKQKDLNIRQRQWMELLKDYDYSILYHPRIANEVIDVLSHKSIGSLTYIAIERRPLIQKLHELHDQGI